MMSRDTYRDLVEGYWPLTKVVCRLLLNIAAIVSFLIACLTDEYGMAIFFGVMLIVLEISAPQGRSPR